MGKARAMKNRKSGKGKPVSPSVRQNTSKNQKEKYKNKSSRENSTNKQSVPPMDKKEVKSLTNRINNSTSVVQKDLTHIYLTKGWEHLGYDNFKEYIEVEMRHISYSTASRYVKIGSVVCELEGLDAVGKCTNNAIAPLLPLTIVHRQKVWSALMANKETKTIGKLTKTQVQKQIDKLNIKVKPRENIKTDGCNKKRLVAALSQVTGSRSSLKLLSDAIKEALPQEVKMLVSFLAD